MGQVIGADLVNHAISEKGEGLLGLVLGTKNIMQFRASAIENGYPLSEISTGHGINEQNEKRE